MNKNKKSERLLVLLQRRQTRPDLSQHGGQAANDRSMLQAQLHERWQVHTDEQFGDMRLQAQLLRTQV